ncbi:MAG: hypothetical protein AAGK47_02155 [Bacteroidota bacterium]
MLKLFAQFVSILFHPLLMMTYMLVILLLVNPYLFGVNSLNGGMNLVIPVFLFTFFIPALAVSMMKFLGLVQSFAMEDRMDRIGPYIITGIFYLWIFRNFLSNSEIPTAYTSFVLGGVIALFVAFFINIFSKISLHAVGMGGLMGMVIITMFLFSYGAFTVDIPSIGNVQMSMLTILLITILLTGLVGTCRLILSAHRPVDLYGGYLVGFLTQFLALRFLF